MFHIEAKWQSGSLAGEEDRGAPQGVPLDHLLRKQTVLAAQREEILHMG